MLSSQMLQNIQSSRLSNQSQQKHETVRIPINFGHGFCRSNLAQIHYQSRKIIGWNPKHLNHLSGWTQRQLDFEQVQNVQK